jgi:hypothetical protein
MDDFGKPNRQASNRSTFQIMPLRLFVLVLTFPILASIVGEGLALVLVANDDQIEIVFFPLVEEIFKLALFIRFPRHFIIGIVSFGIVELAVVKLSSFLISPWPGGVSEWSFFVFPPLLFHVATAIAYGAVRARQRAYAIFILCLVAHVLFNSLTLLDVSAFVWMALVLFTSVFVVLAGRAIASRALA